MRYEHEKATATELGQQVLTLQNELRQLKADMQENGDDKLSSKEEFDTAFTISTWIQHINDHILEIKEGGKTTLKEIIPQSEWLRISETGRKMLGKQFKQMVDRGDFVGLTAIPEKTTSNEQLYRKSL